MTIGHPLPHAGVPSGDLGPVCPECARSGTETGADLEQRCPKHELYLVDVQQVVHLDNHPLLGQVLDGKYALISVVGAGGFGAVYGGLQLPLRRPVAVKVLLGATFTQKVARERFEREAMALARLRSEHTVRLLDFGVCRDANAATRNLPYLVMELIDGEPLNVRHGRAPLSLAQIADLADDVAESLAEAHAAGIVHRDLKPSNILMTADFQGRTLAKVIDFGIARVEDATRSEAGQVIGTPRYMAPEQARSSADLDGRVDVYALGVILYELVTGKVPFSHDQQMVVLQMQVTDEVPSFAARGARPALDRVEAVVRRALAKAPAERHENPLSLAASFRAAVEATPAVSTETVRPERPVGHEDPQFMPTMTPTPMSAPVWQSDAGTATPSTSSPTSDRRSKRSIVLAGAVLAGGATSAAFLWSSGPDATRTTRPPPDAQATALPSPDAPPPGLGADLPIPPRSEAPPSAVSETPPSAPVPHTAARMSVAAALSGPTSRPRPPTPRSAEADPDEAARALAREADAALLKCRCAAADAALLALAKKPGAGRLMPPLSARLAECRNIDPDHRCVDGRLEEIP